MPQGLAQGERSGRASPPGMGFRSLTVGHPYSDLILTFLMNVNINVTEKRLSSPRFMLASKTSVRVGG